MERMPVRQRARLMMAVEGTCLIGTVRRGTRYEPFCVGGDLVLTCRRTSIWSRRRPTKRTFLEIGRSMAVPRLVTHPSDLRIY